MTPRPAALLFLAFLAGCALFGASGVEPGPWLLHQLGR